MRADSPHLSVHCSSPDRQHLLNVSSDDSLSSSSLSCSSAAGHRPPSPPRRYRHRQRLKWRLGGVLIFMVVYVCLVVAGVNFGRSTTSYSVPPKQNRALLELSLMDSLDGPHCGDESTLGKAGLPLWILGVVYMFFGLAIVCDDYFVDSLERISIALDLSDDVAGATFMAAGSSAPEFFTALVGAFFKSEEENPGTGTIVGSAVFNITVIIGLTAVLAGETLHLDWWPLIRDSSYYSISIVLLVVVFVGITPGEVHWWEGLIMVLFYFGYIGIMKYNSQIIGWLNEKRESAIIQEHEAMTRSKIDGEAPLPFERFRGMNPRFRSIYRQGVEYESRMRAASQGEKARRQKEMELPSVRFKVGAKAVILANKFKEKGEAHEDGEPSASKSKDADEKPDNSSDVEANDDERKNKDGKLDGSFGGGDSDSVKQKSSDEDDDDDSPRAGLCKRIGKRCIVIASYPWLLAFRYTIPDSSQQRWAKYYMLSFSMSIFWIGVISFFMVDFASKLGFCLGLSANVMGLTILAAGTSVPDALSSVLVARDGKGDMAVSNAVGSNVFDILLGLGFPWFISTFNGPTNIDTGGIVVYTLILFAVLIAFIGLLVYTKFRLYKWIGYLMFVMYVAFVIFSLIWDTQKNA
uniref:Sodium/potassium/calcium exchanger 3 n=1 Tax=Hirondellea gigas TaxID=1518452 RepID=A0A2P2IBR4_9CRUS